jgi:hypothetical protein
VHLTYLDRYQNAAASFVLGKIGSAGMPRILAAMRLRDSGVLMPMTGTFG